MLASGMRVGLGHDTHRLVPGGPLRMGGLEIPCELSLVGHSDADVLLHAVTDALLGAIAMGDIGELFPDTEAANKDRDSAGMLGEEAGRIAAAGYQIVNLDCIVFAQQPKLGAHKRAMAERIADILQIGPNQISVKAKTGEGVGPIGRGEAISTECIVLIEKGVLD